MVDKIIRRRRLGQNKRDGLCSLKDEIPRSGLEGSNGYGHMRVAQCVCSGRVEILWP